jgi:serine/threonine protein kinase
MSTGFDDSDELLAAYLAESGETDLGDEAPPRMWGDGREIGEWTVTGFLARGGSAEVYCAKHRRLGTRAALKVLWRDGTGPRERFDKESRFMMGNPGPSFPSFYGAGVEDGRPWVAMELLDECPLPSADREVARYLLDVGKGVAALHARNWLHRDIKPGNILRRADGHAVLADFGLLKAVGTGDAPSDAAAERESPSVVDGREAGVGTPGHSAPEQFAGGGATPAADVYALGMLAEECFGGHPPRAWEKIVKRATAALPRQRYPDVNPMLRAIRRRHWVRNWSWALLAALGVALAAAVLSRGTRMVRPAAMAREAERAREMAVRRASEGTGREVIAGILRDMVVLEGAEGLHNSLRKDLGLPPGPVLIGRHEVTQAQWDALMDGNPSRFKGADRPVEGVTIGECLEFLGRLNRMPDVREAGLRFRLPTAEEWTLAAGDRLARRHDYWHKFAMAATNPYNGDFPGEPLETGWFSENSGGETHPVGQTPPDERGLYDCYGNVAELVFAVSGMKERDSFYVTGLRCMGGSYLQRQSEFDAPNLLGVLGREIETLPEEWQPIVRATDIPVRLPEAMVAAHPDRAAKYSGMGVGLRLCADKLEEGEQ